MNTENMHLPAEGEPKERMAYHPHPSPLPSRERGN